MKTYPAVALLAAVLFAPAGWAQQAPAPDPAPAATAAASDTPEAVLSAFLQALMACRLERASTYLHVPRAVLWRRAAGNGPGAVPPPYSLFNFDGLLSQHAPYRSEASYKRTLQREVRCDFAGFIRFYPEKTRLRTVQRDDAAGTATVAAQVHWHSQQDGRDTHFPFAYRLQRTAQGWKVLPGTHYPDEVAFDTEVPGNGSR